MYFMRLWVEIFLDWDTPSSLTSTKLLLTSHIITHIPPVHMIALIMIKAYVLQLLQAVLPRYKMTERPPADEGVNDVTRYCS